MSLIFITAKKKLNSIFFCNNSKILLINNIGEYSFLLINKNLKPFFHVFKDFFFIINHVYAYKLKNLIFNYFNSITLGFVLILEIHGLGFSVCSSKGLLRFNLGYNHSIFYFIPKNVIIKVKRKKIFLFSKSFFLLKSLVVEFKNLRKLSAYKLKGIKDKNELYVKKNWKKNII